MDPFTLLALATAAGFVFNKIGGSPSKEERREFTYSKDLVARLKPDTKAEFDLHNIDVLEEYRLVRGLVQQEFPIVFITGGAGTGKSTFVRWALQEFAGKVLLGAPTSSAAITIGGKTLHSLCQLPTGWITQRDIQQAPRRRELVEASLLIIDEISMVTANLLDGVSGFLRVNRNVDKPFGGLPVILIGDMFQLPPVVPSSLLERYAKVYGSPQFYNARCLQESTYYAVELKKTYRQSDQQFVDILTRIREGVALGDCLAQLNQYCPITTSPPEGSVFLSPRNKEVDTRNEMMMSRLRGREKTYYGKVEGQFQANRYPAPAKLLLKPGCQVMFTRNDSAKRWTNGTVGTVQRLLDNKVFVKLNESEKIVDVGPTRWLDYQYVWNQRRRCIDRLETGIYRQLPLLPAWAITIHKSQGKTIEKVHLDLGSGAFETGQTYVALSRCRSLRGLSLSRPLTPADILIDHESKLFYHNLRNIITKLPPQKMMRQLGI
jgi:ATP-dependent DNA helicase PIF1